MSLLSRLSAVAAALGRSESEPDPGRERQIAVVALLAHIARADGRVDAREADRLTRLVAGRFGLTAPEAAAVIAEATAMDDAVRDLAALVEVAAHDADADERQAILAMAWAVAAADGRVHEFEEAQMARLAALLGLDEAAAAVARAFAEQNGTPEGGA
jgi:uncharacterized tellurite resistance protein B-like protein